MLKLLLFSIISMLGLGSCSTQAQTQPVVKTTYMQIFYEGSGWLAGRPVLHYSPAFRGKTGELVREDSTRAMSPGALILEGPQTGVTYSATTSVATEEGSFVRGADGKMRPQTEADIRKERAEENARMSRGLNLVEARATLARTALTTALNEAAADGWEVAQMTTWGTQGGLVYLLRRH